MKPLFYRPDNTPVYPVDYVEYIISHNGIHKRDIPYYTGQKPIPDDHRGVLGQYPKASIEAWDRYFKTHKTIMVYWGMQEIGYVNHNGVLI